MNSNLTGKPSIDRPWLKCYTEEEKNTEIPKMSAYEYLYHQNKKYLGRVALSYFDREITFNELFSKIEDTAKALEAYGINKGDIVSISLPNIPEVVYLFYAVSKIGAIANMIDPRTSSEGIKNYVKEVNSDLLIVIDSYYNKVNTFVDDNLVKEIFTFLNNNLSFDGHLLVQIVQTKIMDIMDAAQNAEYKKLVVAGEPLNRKEQRSLEKNAQQQKQQVEIPTEDEE